MRREKKSREKEKLQSRFTRNGIAALSLSVLAAVPYLTSLPNPFVYDDRLQVLENPYAHSLRYVGKIFGGGMWMFQGAQGVTNYYRPLQALSYLVLYGLFGANSLPFHALSVVLHVGVVLLIFALTEALFGDFVMSFVSAALFALHPIHSESVLWISDLTDLELCFFLLTFVCYLRATRASDGKSWIWQVAAVASYLCALLSKEPAMMLPLLAVAYEHLYRADRGSTAFRVKLARYAPLVVTALAYVELRRLLLGAFAPAVFRSSLAWPQVALSAVALTGNYLEKLIWPAHLSVFYVFHPSERWRDAAVLEGFAALLLCAGLFLWLWRRAHMVSFAFLWMGATLAPVLNARWLTGGVFAERYLYLPSVGFCWLIGWAVAVIWHSATVERPGSKYSSRQMAVLAGLGVLFLCCGAAVVRRNRDWRTEETLYQRTLEEQPDAQLIRTNLGLIYWNNGDALAAEREWERAMGPEPPYLTTLDNLGLVRTVQQNYPQAIALFQRAIQESPQYAPAHKNLAAAYADAGKLADADREFRVAVGLAPLNVEGRNAYGHFLQDQNRDADAEEQFRASLAADDNGDAEDSLGEIMMSHDQPAAAETAFAAALALDPADSRAHLGMGAVREQQGRAGEAASEYRAALSSDPQNAAAAAGLRRLHQNLQ